MKFSTMLWTAALLIAVFSAFGCGSGGSDGPSAADSITIDAVTPSTVSAGTPTTFTISVSYSLQTRGSGVINYAFGSGTSYSLETDERIVSKGTGTALFIAAKTLAETSTVRVLLSEYPHSASWSPLVSTEQVITVN